MAETESYVIQEVSKSVDINGIETQISTQEIVQDYHDETGISVKIETDTADQIIYSNDKKFSFIEFISDQTVTVDFQTDGVSFFTGDIKHFRVNLAGDKLSVTVTNESTYVATIKLLVLTEYIDEVIPPA